MSSSSEENVQISLDQSGNENTEDIDSGVGEANSRKENVRIAEVPFDNNKGELWDICFMYSITPEYKLIRPSEAMRVTELLDEDSIMIYKESFQFCGMAPKTVKSSKLSKAAEAMRKKSNKGSLEKGA
ncbi:hypothetical protein JCGZ_05338 [Jatropha curcas]|uniref:Uncharacterized protein n=1 Tax=Jatropha curcas TaxID=180498 RepID=A0A067L1B0_JATCU|nr:hypothetical protein JCGZ_05338 [Jatropha curcas]